MRKLLMLTALTSLSLGVDAIACGESLYRVGKGVAYREYTAPLPGNLLVYGGAGNTGELAEQLQRAGHLVTVAESVAELVRLSEAGSFDIVIGRYHDYDDFKSTALLSDATYLPIAVEGIDEREARKQFSYVMVPTKHEIKHYLKAIHRVLKAA